MNTINPKTIKNTTNPTTTQNTTNPTTTQNTTNPTTQFSWGPDASNIIIPTRPKASIVPLDLNNLPTVPQTTFFNEHSNDANRFQLLNSNVLSRSQNSLSKVIEPPVTKPKNTIKMKSIIDKNKVFVPDFTETFSIRSIKEGMTAFSKNGQKNSALSISYNFPRFTINKSDIHESSSYFSITYTSNSSTPNFIFTQKTTSTNYFSQNAYLFGVLHNIIGVTVEDDGYTKINNIVGELVIDVGQSCYICFILQNSQNNLTNDIDKFALLKNQEDDSLSCKNSGNTNVLSLDIILNNSITKQNWTVYYLDGTTKVFVFTNPIMVNATTATFVSKLNNTTTLFSTDIPSTGWSQITNVGITGDDEIYIDCQPTGVSDEEINMRTVALGNDSVSGSNDKISQLFLSNIATFTIMFILAWFFIPFSYRYIVINNLNNSDWSPTKKASRYVITGTMLFLCFCSIGIALLYTGNSNYGINVLIFTGFSFLILYSNTFMNEDFLKTGKKQIQLSSIIDSIKMKEYLDISKMFTTLLGFLVYTFIDEKEKPRTYTIGIFLFYLFIVFIALPLYFHEQYLGIYAVYSLIGAIDLLLLLMLITVLMDYKSNS